jgi:FtsP/CotA-like multicopper oxidase with cupredoxin domain
MGAFIDTLSSVQLHSNRATYCFLRSFSMTSAQDAPKAQLEPTDILKTPTSRRSFLRWSGLIAAAGTLTACGKSAVTPPAVATLPAGVGGAKVDAAAAAPMDHSAAPAAAATSEPATQTTGSAWEEMDRMHQAGVEAFPAKTEGLGMQPLDYRMDNGVKVFDLTCEKIMWEVEVGKKLEAWVYNGQLPGPEIRITEGDKVRINLTNKLDQSTAIHFHGVMLPNNMDGVPFITQPPVTPGSSFTYEFTARNPGSHMYHSHHNSTKQVSMGLLGPFIIEPKDKSKDPAYDKEYTIILNDTSQGLTLNGKSFPATQPLTAKLGQKVRIRYMNEGMMIHPMHLHGLPQLVFSKDGWNLPQPYLCDTLNVAPGERWDVIVDCTDPGIWAFHCHILSHAESEHGMFGMVTVLIVEE